MPVPYVSDLDLTKDYELLHSPIEKMTEGLQKHGPVIMVKRNGRVRAAILCASQVVIQRQTR